MNQEIRTEIERVAYDLYERSGRLLTGVSAPGRLDPLYERHRLAAARR